MYAGKSVENGLGVDIFKDPQHTYTRGLIQSVSHMRRTQERLYSIPGNAPCPGSIKQGCRFASRCEFAFDRCFQEDPPLYSTTEGRSTRCFLFVGEEDNVNDNRTAVKS